MPRRRFIPVTYQFFAANLLIFAVLLWASAGTPLVEWLGYAFYVWLSVYNLFAVSIFWAVMSDIFSREQGKRLFGLIGVGGTLGALCGSAVVKQVSGPADQGGIVLDAHHLMLISVGFIQAAVFCIARLATLPGMSSASPQREPGPGVLEGLRLLVRSRYLLMIAVYMVLFTTLSTYLYLEQGRIVAESAATAEERRRVFASIEFWGQSLTICTQLFLTGAILSRLGVTVALAILPIVSLAGFAWLLHSPTLTTLVVFQVLRRGLHHAIDRPAREVLYTIVTPDARYKSKSFIDTFVYRAGDMGGAWTPLLLRQAGIPVALAGAGIAAAWLGAGLLLGRLHAIAADRHKRRTQ
jgi:ATP:ADP antiporter, AAA family